MKLRGAGKITSDFGLKLPGDSLSLYHSDRSRFTTPERSDDFQSFLKEQIQKNSFYEGRLCNFVFRMDSPFSSIV